MRKPALILTLVCVLATTGCQNHQAREKARQETANAAAGIYEAAVAIEQGVQPEKPLMAIKMAASAIITTQGRIYVPAKVWIESLKGTK